MKNFLYTLAFGFLCTAPMVGCGDKGPSNSVENVDAKAVQDYEKMVAEDAAAMDEAMQGEDESGGAAKAE